MVKEHTLSLMEKSMLENLGMVNFMVREQGLSLMEECMLGVYRMENIMVKGHTLSLMEKKYVGEFREGIPWNISYYDENGMITDNYVNGERVPVERVEEQATVVEEVVEE